MPDAPPVPPPYVMGSLADFLETYASGTESHNKCGMFHEKLGT
jgi:hypothetical protein